MVRSKKKFPYCSPLLNPVTPESTIIAFDLHDVVFKKQTRKIVMQGLRLLPRGTWRYTFSPRVWYRLYKIRSQSDVAEDIFEKVALQYPGLLPFRNDFMRMVNTQRPVAQVFDIIKQLKSQGYSLYILSNIGHDTFKGLCEIYPELNDHFSGAFTPTAENKYLHKPHPEFYEQFKEFVKEKGHVTHQILFIDDLKKNLASAARCNIAGVHFTSPKKLIRTFESLEIFKAK